MHASAISPAGRIERRNGDRREEHYFVDGGYFDNSGAGVALEMIQRIEQMKVHPPQDMPFLRKLQPYVYHISNSPKPLPSYVVSPVVNDYSRACEDPDGAYGMQTDINDQRLLNYLDRAYPLGDHYHDIALYREGGRARAIR
ncbi:MAG: hypothetical protein IPJ85_14150 [Flavobacteriales bacterium]|nr:hypothetical protein [Flavobacteriales bacterium]